MNNSEMQKKLKEAGIDSFKIRANQVGSNNSQFGTIWITNGTQNKKLKNLDEIPEGWYKGMISRREV